MTPAALTSRRTQDELLRQVCAARLFARVQFHGINGQHREWPGHFVAFDSDGLWLSIPELMPSTDILTDTRMNIHFEVGRPLCAVATCIGRLPRTDGSGPRMLLCSRRPTRIEWHERPTTLNVMSDDLRGVSAVLFDLDDARLTYSPRPLRFTNRQVVVAIDPPEEFRGGDMFQLQLAIPGQRLLATLFLRRKSTAFDRGGATITFSTVSGDEPQWTREPLGRLALLNRSSGSYSTGGRVLIESCDVETPC